MIYNLTPQSFFNKIQENPQSLIIDVRTPEEYNHSHIPKAINIDALAPDFQKQLQKLPPQKALFIYCQSGGRSSPACHYLEKQGYQNIYHLQNGFYYWEGPIEPDQNNEKLPLACQIRYN